MYSNNENEIDKMRSAWMLTKRFSPDAKTNATIRCRVEEYFESGGYVAVSHFERAYLELLNEDAIRPFRGTVTEQPATAPVIPQDLINWIESPRTSVQELRLRYRNDQDFRKQYDLYEKTKGQTQETSGGALSVEDYRRMPAATVAQRYRKDRSFRAQVDALIKKGLI
jgi:hypothetical protein